MVAAVAWNHHSDGVDPRSADYGRGKLWPSGRHHPIIIITIIITFISVDIVRSEANIATPPWIEFNSFITDARGSRDSYRHHRRWRRRVYILLLLYNTRWAYTGCSVQNRMHFQKRKIDRIKLLLDFYEILYNKILRTETQHQPFYYGGNLYTYT